MMADGQTYEWAAIEQWLADQPAGQQLVSLVTQEPLPHAFIMSNLSIRALMYP